jgi:hypothetical protein
LEVRVVVVAWALGHIAFVLLACELPS